VLNRLAKGESVTVALRAADPSAVRSGLARLGVETHVIETPSLDVKRIREKLGLSQFEFALKFDLELDTVQNWEQGRNVPDSATQLLLKIIETTPETVEAVLTPMRQPKQPQKGKKQKDRTVK
jgi:DNA-binding transcriptional regulator YiaG